MGMRHRTPSMGVIKEPTLYMPMFMAVAVRAQAHERTPDMGVVTYPGVSFYVWPERARHYGHTHPDGPEGIPLAI